MPNFAAFDPDNLLLGTPSGRFEETGDAAGIAQDTRGRGAVIEDFNADGQLDLLVVNREAQPGLFRNLGPAGASTAMLRLMWSTPAPSAGALWPLNGKSIMSHSVLTRVRDESDEPAEGHAVS